MLLLYRNTLKSLAMCFYTYILTVSMNGYVYVLLYIENHTEKFGNVFLYIVTVTINGYVTINWCVTIYRNCYYIETHWKVWKCVSIYRFYIQLLYSNTSKNFYIETHWRNFQCVSNICSNISIIVTCFYVWMETFPKQCVSIFSNCFY